MTEETQKTQPRLKTDDPNRNHQINAIIIDEDRYGGCYSGHKFTAWFKAAPDDIDAGDVMCNEFWATNDVAFGGGDAPDEAVADLLEKILEQYDYKPTPYPNVIYNTSKYTGFDITTVFVGCVQDPRFQTVYPKSYEIYKRHWG